MKTIPAVSALAAVAALVLAACTSAPGTTPAPHKTPQVSALAPPAGPAQHVNVATPAPFSKPVPKADMRYPTLYGYWIVHNAFMVFVDQKGHAAISDAWGVIDQVNLRPVRIDGKRAFRGTVIIPGPTFPRDAQVLLLPQDSGHVILKVRPGGNKRWQQFGLRVKPRSDKTWLRFSLWRD